MLIMMEYQTTKTTVLSSQTLIRRMMTIMAWVTSAKGTVTEMLLWTMMMSVLAIPILSLQTSEISNQFPWDKLASHRLFGSSGMEARKSSKRSTVPLVLL